VLRRVRFLPRTAQIGLRGLSRRRRASISTALVIAFAVGTLLAAQGLATAVTNTSRDSRADHSEDVKITVQGLRPLDTNAARHIQTTPGVATIEPMFVTDTTLAGNDAKAWAVRSHTMFHYRLASDAGTRQPNSRRALASRSSNVTSPAPPTPSSVTASASKTAAGPVNFRVIGIATNQQENGTALFAPLRTMHALLPGRPADADGYWVRTLPKTTRPSTAPPPASNTPCPHTVTTLVTKSNASNSPTSRQLPRPHHHHGKQPHEFLLFRTDVAANALPVDADGLKVGGTQCLPVRLNPGHYVAVCNLTNHYKLGMYST
jgi:hypothetical protein